MGGDSRRATVGRYALPPEGSDRVAPPIDDTLADLEIRLRLLAPDHRDPHRFHEDKSELADALARLRRRLAAETRSKSVCGSGS